MANFAAGVVPMPPTVTKVPDGAPTAISTCNKWYQAVGNDNCDSITTYFGTFSKAGKKISLAMRLITLNVTLTTRVVQRRLH